MTESPEQQLRQLEEKYRQERAQIQQQIGERKEEMPSEHETMSRIVEEAIQQHVPTFQALSHSPVSATDDLSPEEEAKVQTWVTMVFTKSLTKGIKAAKASDDPALIDAFHAALTGELYGQLVAGKKLETVN